MQHVTLSVSMEMNVHFVLKLVCGHFVHVCLANENVYLFSTRFLISSVGHMQPILSAAPKLDS